MHAWLPSPQVDDNLRNLPVLLMVMRVTRALVENKHLHAQLESYVRSPTSNAGALAICVCVAPLTAACVACAAAPDHASRADMRRWQKAVCQHRHRQPLGAA